MNQTQNITARPKHLDELFQDSRLLGHDCDPIVGLVHKHFFIRDLNRRAYECSRYGIEVSLVLIQIHNLSEAFTEKSRLAAELGRIGTLLDDNLRLTDLATWYAPCAFAIQMPHVRSNEAKMVCDRLVAILERQLAFNAEIDFQIRELDDMHTADLLLSKLKDSQFRDSITEGSVFFMGGE